jgi:hypothetical protein
MKILFVINGLVSGGAEKLLNDMLPILKKKNDVEYYECRNIDVVLHDVSEYQSTKS